MTTQAPERYIVPGWVDRFTDRPDPSPSPAVGRKKHPVEIARSQSVVETMTHRARQEREASRDLPAILIAEDNDLVRKVMRELFEDEGFSVVADCSNGADAVTAAGAHRPDVILMDLRMPVLGGIEATARITQELPNIQVILLTAYDDPALKADAIEAGAYRFMAKGCSVRLLVETVHSAWARARELTESG